MTPTPDSSQPSAREIRLREDIGQLEFIVKEVIAKCEAANREVDDDFHLNWPVMSPFQIAEYRRKIVGLVTPVTDLAAYCVIPRTEIAELRRELAEQRIRVSAAVVALEGFESVKADRDALRLDVVALREALKSARISLGYAREKITEPKCAEGEFTAIIQQATDALTLATTHPNPVAEREHTQIAEARRCQSPKP